MAVTVPDQNTALSRGPGQHSVAASADIVLQSNPLSPGYFGSMSHQEVATTLIHELGHVFNTVAGLGGSKILYDGDENGGANDDAQKKNEATLKKCKPI
jgi:hypothetical protein